MLSWSGGFPQGLSAGSEKPILTKGGGLAAPWFVSAFPWTISFPHLSVCLLECSFKIFLNASNLILTQIYFSF